MSKEVIKMPPLPVKMIMMSHLSDIQDMGGAMPHAEVRDRLNFVKYLILNFPDNNVEIVAEDEYEKYEKKHKKKK
jgi:hypothetical protein